MSILQPTATELKRLACWALRDSYGFAPQAMKEIILLEASGDMIEGYIMFRINHVEYQFYYNQTDSELEIFKRDGVILEHRRIEEEWNE